MLATIWPSFYSHGQKPLHNDLRPLRCAFTHHCDGFSLVSQSEFTSMISQDSHLQFPLSMFIWLFLLPCISQSCCFYSSRRYWVIPLARRLHSQLLQSFAFPFTAAGSRRFFFNMALLQKQPLGILNLNLKLSEFLVMVPTHPPTQQLPAS